MNDRIGIKTKCEQCFTELVVGSMLKVDDIWGYAIHQGIDNNEIVNIIYGKDEMTIIITPYACKHCKWKRR